MTSREQHTAQWKASGLSRAAYCRQVGLAYHLSRTWIKSSSALPSRADTSSFIEVLRRPAERVANHSMPPAAVCLPNGIVLRVEAGTDPAWIGRVLAEVRPC